MLHPKKVSTLPVEGRDEQKQTNEIKTAAPLLDPIDIVGRTITADALLTQCDFANYLVERGANYHFTAKGNQPTLLEEIAYYFQNQPPMPAEFIQTGQGEHGRIETRKIWTTTAHIREQTCPCYSQHGPLQNGRRLYTDIWQQPFTCRD